MIQRWLLVSSLLAGTAGILSAQTAPPTQTQTLVTGDVENGFLFAPDFKFTEVAGDFANLAGGYGGWVLNRKLLLGGGAYTLTNGGGNDMTYGGGVIEYFVSSSSLVNLSFRGLVGGGSATVRGSGFGPDFGYDDVPSAPFLGNLFGRRGGRFPDDDFPRFGPRSSSRTSFFVAEPEANVMLNVTEKFRLGFGGGYRFIGGAGPLQNALDGFTASVALKLAFF